MLTDSLIYHVRSEYMSALTSVQKLWRDWTRAMSDSDSFVYKKKIKHDPVAPDNTISAQVNIQMTDF